MPRRCNFTFLRFYNSEYHRIRSVLLGMETPRRGNLANNELAFSLIEVMGGNLEVELGGMRNQQVQSDGIGRLTGAGPLRIRPASRVVREPGRFSVRNGSNTHRYRNENHGRGRTCRRRNGERTKDESTDRTHHPPKSPDSPMGTQPR